MPKEDNCSEPKQPQRTRLWHDDAFPEPIVAGVLHSIVPRIPAKVTGRILIADIQTTCGQKHRLKEIELARSDRDVVWIIESSDLNRPPYQNERVCAADNWTVVSSLTQIHRNQHPSSVV